MDKSKGGDLGVKASLAALVFVWIPFSGCGSLPDHSLPKVANGIDISLSSYPGVVKIGMGEKGKSLDALCTATWVSANTLMTAAHCMWDWENNQVWQDVWVVDGVGKDLVSSKIYIHPEYTWEGAGSIYDLAVVVFPAKSVSQFIPLALTPPKKGDAIEIVGYGLVEAKNYKSSGVRRKGSNKIFDVGKRIAFRGYFKQMGFTSDGRKISTGKEVLNLTGDSGGGMFELSSKQLIGVSSTVGVAIIDGNKREGYYANVHHPDHQKFLRDVVKNYGAKISNLK